MPKSILKYGFFLIFILALFTKIEEVELYAEEPRRAIVALEMQLTGEWIVPKTHGENYYNKPPLYNWVLLGVAKMLGGFSELSVRLPGLLSFLLLAVGIFYVAKKYLNKKVAILATLGFLANPEMLFYGTLVSGEIDLFFSLLIFWQVVVLFHCLEKGRDLKAFAISYLLAGVGMLTKGLPALAFQGLTIVAWLLVSKRPEKLFSWQHIVGGLVFFVPTVLYAYAYVQKEPLTPFLINLFMESAQQTPVEKTTGQTVGTFLRFPGQLLVMFMPFSLLLIPLAIRVKKVKAVLRNYRWLLFCQVFIIANIWLYWISPGNESRYLYPFYPFVYILFAMALAKLNKNASIKKWINGLVFTFLVVLIVLSFLALFQEDFQHLDYLYPLCIGSMAIGIMMMAGYFRYGSTVLSFFMVMALLRLEYNFLVKPTIEASDSRVYRENMRFISQTLEEDITFLDDQKVDVNNVFGVTDTLYTPPHLPYAIPFYYSLYTDKVLHYDDEVAPGKTYISRDKVPGHMSLDTLYHFQRGDNKPWVVFRVHE